MAGSKNQVTLTMVGDTDKLEKAFDRVGSSAAAMDSDVSKASRNIGSSADSFDRVGDGFDELDTKAMGFRDGITGVQDTMTGFGQLMEGDVAGGLLTLGMGIGDLASSMVNLIVPTVKAAATWVSSHASMAASSIATAASAVASWVTTAAASVVNAAIVAASWLLAFAPVIIVVAIVIALVVVIIKNWDKIKAVIQAGWDFVKRITATVWNGIKAVVSAAIRLVVGHIRRQIAIAKAIFRGFKTAVGAIFRGIKSTITSQLNLIMSGFRRFKSTVSSIFRGVGRAITAPIRSALSGIRSIWNSTIGGKGISIPGFLGFGGISFTIPRLAKGGIIPASMGGTPFIGGEGGQAEAVIPLDRLDRMMRGSGGGRTVIELRSSGSEIDDLVLGILRKAIKNQGGGSVAVLG